VINISDIAISAWIFRLRIIKFVGIMRDMGSNAVDPEAAIMCFAVSEGVLVRKLMPVSGEKKDRGGMTASHHENTARSPFKLHGRRDCL
jgi:hypothetical protein